jgi:hypothetical protein
LIWGNVKDIKIKLKFDEITNMEHPMQPMPAYVLQTQKAHASILERVRWATLNDGLMPQMALALAHIGAETVSCREFQGHHMLGTNPTYSLRIMKEKGFILITSAKDLRSKRVSLTEAGLAVAEKVRKILNGECNDSLQG